MDKANARILFLVLIAVMFIGQAVYDFVKKNRSQKRPLLSTPKPELPKTTAKAYKVTAAEQVKTAAKVTERAKEPAPPNEAPAPTSRHIEDPADELRRAIIWSEILKRKY